MGVSLPAMSGQACALRHPQYGPIIPDLDDELDRELVEIDEAPFEDDEESDEEVQDSDEDDEEVNDENDEEAE